MRDIVHPLNDLGATLVAITPQMAEHNKAMIEKHRLPFDMLSDPGNDYAEKLGIRFVLPPALNELYANVGGIDLVKTNGDDSGTLPMPARFVIDSSGIVRAVDADPDYTRRPEPEKALADVRALG